MQITHIYIQVRCKNCTVGFFLSGQRHAVYKQFDYKTIKSVADAVHNKK